MTTANALTAVRTNAIPGRAAIAARAYEQLIRAVAGEALGVGPRDSSVKLSDAAGQMSIEVTGPIRGEGPPVLERVGTARELIATRVAALTGASVKHVSIHVTRIRFTEGRTR